MMMIRLKLKADEAFKNGTPHEVFLRLKKLFVTESLKLRWDYMANIFGTSLGN
jgi:hypothetical protein